MGIFNKGKKKKTTEVVPIDEQVQKTDDVVEHETVEEVSDEQAAQIQEIVDDCENGNVEVIDSEVTDVVDAVTDEFGEDVGSVEDTVDAATNDVANDAVDDVTDNMMDDVSEDTVGEHDMGKKKKHDKKKDILNTDEQRDDAIDNVVPDESLASDVSEQDNAKSDIEDETNAAPNTEQVDAEVNTEQVDAEVNTEQVDAEVNTEQVDDGVGTKQQTDSVSNEQESSVDSKAKTPEININSDKDTGVGGMFKTIGKLIRYVLQAVVILFVAVSIVVICAQLAVSFTYSAVERGVLGSMDALTLFSAISGGGTAGALFLIPHMWRGLNNLVAWIGSRFNK